MINVTIDESIAGTPGLSVEPAPPLTVTPGRPHPLGATPGPDGVNFSVRSEHAAWIELLLFDSPSDPEPAHVVTLGARTGDVRHAHVGGARPGMGYAYRAHGHWDPGPGGRRPDPDALLLDPYAHAVETSRWDPWDAQVETPGGPRGVVVDLAGYDWGDDAPPRRPLAESVLYELAVGGFTRGPDAGVTAPGTFQGLAEKIPYLTRLGVTAVVLSAQQFDAADGAIGPLAPHGGYCRDPARAVREFRDLVRALHAAGLEAILDLVPDHAGDDDDGGPVISLLGLGNGACCRPDGTLEHDHPAVRKLDGDCLAFWARELHVDGFRFARGPAPDPALVLTDDLVDVKLLTAPGQPAGEGYFPRHRWTTADEDFGDVLGRFVTGEPGLLGAVAARLTGPGGLRSPAATDGQATDRQAKNMAALLLLSSGVPVLRMGEEVGGVPGAWFDWQGPLHHPDLLRFVQRMIGLRRAHRLLQGGPSAAPRWHGTRLDQPGWDDPAGRALALTLAPAAATHPDLHVIANMADDVLAFELPRVEGRRWLRAVDTGLPGSADIADPGEEVPIQGEHYLANAGTVVVLVSGP